MKRIGIILLIAMGASLPLLGKKRSRAFGPAHRANRTHAKSTKGNCGQCETNYAACMKAGNAQMQAMCGQSKQQCLTAGKCGTP